MMISRFFGIQLDRPFGFLCHLPARRLVERRLTPLFVCIAASVSLALTASEVAAEPSKKKSMTNIELKSDGTFLRSSDTGAFNPGGLIGPDEQQFAIGDHCVLVTVPRGHELIIRAAVTGHFANEVLVYDDALNLRMAVANHRAPARDTWVIPPKPRDSKYLITGFTTGEQNRHGSWAPMQKTKIEHDKLGNICVAYEDSTCQVNPYRDAMVILVLSKP